jgi:peptidoglycan/xylan/chitin deacetylase (PgdA/CDA1 family)
MALSDLAVRIASRRSVVAVIERFARRSAVSQGSRNRPAVALTFDDGPHPVWTPKILDALDAASAKATFFVVGKHAARHPELVAEARRRGHEIGTHLYSHDKRAAFDDRLFDEEVNRSKAELESILGEKIRWLRFPHGERGRQHPTRVKRAHGLDTAHWTYSGHDGMLADAVDVVARVRAGLRPGVILLLHDALFDEENLPAPYVAARDVTVAAIPGIGELLREHGLSAVTLSELVPSS